MKAVAGNHPSTMSDSTKIILNYSIIISVTYMAIFGIAKLFNLEGHTELRFTNYIVLFFISYSGLKKLYVANGNKIEYLTGLSKTFIMSMLGSFWYCLVFFFIYLHIDKHFTNLLINEFPAQILYPEVSIVAVLFIEGIAMSAIVSLALMQIFKKKSGNWARA